MGKVLIYTENDSLIKKYSRIFEGKYFNFMTSRTESELNILTEKDSPDVYLIDENTTHCNIKQTIQKIKNIRK